MNIRKKKTNKKIFKEVKVFFQKIYINWIERFIGSSINIENSKIFIFKVK